MKGHKQKNIEGSLKDFHWTIVGQLNIKINNDVSGLQPTE